MSSNQHYVPQFLLKNFSENKMVYRYDKIANRTERKNIKSVCSKDDFYNLSLNELCENQSKMKELLQEELGEIPENIYLSCDRSITKIETRTGEIIKKVLSHKNLTILNDEERFMLCLFTSLQMLRTSNHRNNIKTIIETTANKIKEFYDDGINTSISYEDWLEGNIGKDFDISAKLMNITELGEDAMVHAKILFSTKNMFLIDTIDDDLYISDSPVVLYNSKNYRPFGNIGTLVPGVEIYLPLSSHIILAYHCRTLLPPYNILVPLSNYSYEMYRTIETRGCIYQKDIVYFFNYLQLCFSDKYIIAKHDCFDYAKDMIKKYPQLRNCTTKLKAY